MHHWIATPVFAVLLIVFSGLAAASDYAREKKWADEILPNVVVGDPVYLSQANGHKALGIYATATNAKAGVVVAHGIGVHPDHGIIGVLRQRLVDFGFTTLSVQMPILAVDADPAAYVPTFPEAAERLRLAVAFLKGKGAASIVLVTQSLGSRMAYEYMKTNPAEVKAWASLGMSSPGYETVRAPVLDLYGERDLPQVVAGARSRLASMGGAPHSRQVVVPSADHFFTDREEEMLIVLREFLK
ncbi:MAG TPA: hypothetical protein VIS77_14335 [Burkholderiales bacterium]